MFMIYFWNKIKLKVLIFSTIQKPYCRYFSFMAGFIDALRPAPFTGVHFRRWQSRVTLWLNVMGVFWVSNGKPEGQLTAQHEKAYEEANIIFVGAVIGALAVSLQDVYLRNKIGKDLWDAVNNDYGGSYAGTELYIIEQYHDYKIVDGKGVVEQAHEIQCMVKELELLKIIVPNKFVAGGIIAKLPPSWRDFATTLKHKRTHMSISNLVASLDVEEKAQTKDGQSKWVEGQNSANMVHHLQSHGKGKGKHNKNNNKPTQNTTFKKKKNKKEDEGCFVCGSLDHWIKKCTNRKGRKSQPEQKIVNMVINTRDGTSWYGNLPSILSVF
jgi:hypothetical protein